MPGDGEGVRSPYADRWDGDIDVLTGSDFPGTGNIEGDAESIAGKCFDGRFGATTTDVAVDKIPASETTIKDPGAYGGDEEASLRKSG